MRHTIKLIITTVLVSYGTWLGGQSISDTLKDENFELIDNFRELDKTEEESTISTIKVLTKYTDQGMAIRWAPTNPLIWQDGLSRGYIVEKVTFNKVDSNYVWTSLSAEPIKPWPIEEWKTIVNDDSPYCAAAAMCIYGTNQETGFINQFRDQQNKFGFNLFSADMDRKAAEASGLFILDQNVDTTDLMMYSVRLAGSPLSNCTDTVYQFASTSNQYIKVKLEAQSGEEHVLLNWKTPRQALTPSAYHIERSEDGNNFIKVTDRPFLPVTTNVQENENKINFTDSLAIINQEFYYRIIGIDAFSEKFVYSDTITSKAFAKKTLKPIQEVWTQESENLVTVEWKLNIDLDDTEGFYVLRSTDSQQGFERISGLLDRNASRYIDESPDPIKTNFYKIESVDKNGNGISSIHAFAITKDNVAPHPPENLQYFIEDNGSLLIKWDDPEEKDIRGYLIHYSNTDEGPFTVVPGGLLSSAHFVDSLNLKTLTEDMYFYVVAVDYSYNASETSQVLRVKKPDLIPPSPSIFTRYTSDNKLVKIQWKKSQSLDLQRVILERKTNNSEWILMEDFDENQEVFVDSTQVPNVEYIYRLASLDDDGNVSYSPQRIRVTVSDGFFISGISNMEIKDQDENLMLTWDINQEIHHSFKIYKMNTKGEFIYTQKTSNNFFKPIENTTYAIKAIGFDGRESRLSKPFVFGN